MKILILSTFLMLPFTTFAQKGKEILRGKQYRDFTNDSDLNQLDLLQILTIPMDDLKDPNCPSTLLNSTRVKANMAMGNPMHTLIMIDGGKFISFQVSFVKFAKQPASLYQDTVNCDLKPAP